jgi:DNA helicase-2/ATP-dependent DNA helicase PcrA
VGGHLPRPCPSSAENALAGAGLPQNFQILDSDDQLRLVKRVCRELQLDESRWPPKQAQWYINGQKDEGLRAAHIEVPLGDLYLKTMLRIYSAYEEACERGGMVDFAELLLRAHELWLKSPQVLAHYQQRFPADSRGRVPGHQYDSVRLAARAGR